MIAPCELCGWVLRSVGVVGGLDQLKLHVTAGFGDRQTILRFEKTRSVSPFVIGVFGFGFSRRIGTLPAEFGAIESTLRSMNPEQMIYLL